MLSIAPPGITCIDHLLSTALTDGMFYTFDDIPTGLTSVVQPYRMPLPSFGEADPLGDRSVTDLFRAPQEFVMKRNIRSYPSPRFPISSPEVVPILEIFFNV